MMQEGRKFVGGMVYRWGFGNQELEQQLGEVYAYAFRCYNAQICRFMSVDPLSAQYPWNSTYAFAENIVIRCIDLEGLEAFSVGIKNNGNPVISISNQNKFGIEHWSLVCEDPTICAPPNTFYGSGIHYTPTYTPILNRTARAVPIFTFTSSEIFATPFELMEDAVNSFQGTYEESWTQELNQIGNIERGITRTESATVSLTDVVKYAAGNRDAQGTVPLPNLEEYFVFTRIIMFDLKTISVQIAKSVDIRGSDMSSDYILQLTKQFTELGYNVNLMQQGPEHIGSLMINDPNNSRGIDIEMSYNPITKKDKVKERIISETVQRTSTGEVLINRNP
jgi:RHS repeat-associated protein